MAQPTNEENIFDISPDIVENKSIEQVVQDAQYGFSSVGGNTSQIGKSFQSPNFISGSKGWKLSPDGTLEAVNGTFSGTFNIGGTQKTIGTADDVQATINEVETAGGGTVYLKAGTYTLTADITVPGGVALEGVTRDGVIIDCNTSYAVKIAGTDVYSTGTVSINDGQTTVTGSGTTWTAAMEGRYILLNDYYYEITDVASTTSMTIGEAYSGTNLSGSTYVLATVNFNASLRKLTVTGATGSGVVVQYAFEPNINDLVIYSCGTGLDIDYVVYPRIFVSSTGNGTNGDFDYMFGFKIDFCAFDFSTTAAGAEFTNCSGATVLDSEFVGNTGNGVTMTSCSNIAFISNTSDGNGDNGYEFVSGNNDIQFFASTADGNTNDGYSLTATSNRITISGSSIINNGAYGVNIVASTCDDNYIVAPSFANNSSGNINDSGTGTTIIAETNYDNGTYQLTTTPSDQSITTSFLPKRITINAYFADGGNPPNFAQVTVIYTPEGTTKIAIYSDPGTGGGTAADGKLRSDTSNWVNIGVSSVTSTGFTITLDEETTSFAGGGYLIWEAQGY